MSRALKVVTVVGARPQFVKAAVVSRALRSLEVLEVLVHTGQHYDENMSDIFFRDLGIPAPAVELGVGSGPHGDQTGRMLAGLERVLLEERPDWLLVYGDTNSTLAGALAAAKLHVPVAHVEAGLRSFNRKMPEEINRVVTDHVSELLLAPTPAAMRNLADEGIADGAHLVGDVMKDAALFYGSASNGSRVLEAIGATPREYVLVTVHRAENTDHRGRLGALVSALIEASEARPIVLPLHPRTRAALEREGLLSTLDAKCRVIEPVGYLEMLVLERNAALIVTDSGGVQKEAFFFEVPCVTVRDETEWTELVELGWNRLVAPTDAAAIVAAVEDRIGSRGQDSALFGDGNASERIAELLVTPGIER